MRISAPELSTYARDIFIALGASDTNAQVVADHLVDASLRGVDSHGVVRIPVYVQGIQDGGIDPGASPELVKESSATALVDGHRAFGQVVALYATKIAAEKAKKSGSSAVGARNLNHVGTLAYYGRFLAERGLIGKSYTSGFPRAAPWGGRGKVFGTNPLCFAFPSKSTEPIVIDMATTAVAAFKIMLAQKAGSAIPQDWALDPDGSPTTDPTLALKGALLPMAGHKGYGLATSVDLLARVLVGTPPYNMARDVAYTQGGFFVEATDTEAFISRDEYFGGVDELIARIRGSPLAKGHEKVYLPGEPESLTRETLLKEGIPVEKSLSTEFARLGAKYSVRMPAALE